MLVVKTPNTCFCTLSFACFFAFVQVTTIKISGSESFTKWLIGMRDAKGMRGKGYKGNLCTLLTRFAPPQTLHTPHALQTPSHSLYLLHLLMSLCTLFALSTFLPAFAHFHLLTSLFTLHTFSPAFTPYLNFAPSHQLLHPFHLLTRVWRLVRRCKECKGWWEGVNGEGVWRLVRRCKGCKGWWKGAKAGAKVCIRKSPPRTQNYGAKKPNQPLRWL